MYEADEADRPTGDVTGVSVCALPSSVVAASSAHTADGLPEMQVTLLGGAEGDTVKP